MPPSGHASHALLHFAKYGDQVHTGTPFFKILDLPQGRWDVVVRLAGNILL